MAFPAEAPSFGIHRPVLQTVDFLPRPAELPPLRRYPQGVDLAIDISKLPLNARVGLRYEEQCFELLTQGLLKNEVAIGPHLLDKALGKGPYGPYARSDAMRFALINGGLELIELDEFKRKKRNSFMALKDKIEALPSLLDLLRSDLNLLPRLLNEASGEQLDIGAIFIPPNSKIQVRVMTPHNHNENVPIFPFTTVFEQIAPAPQALEV